MKKPAPPHQLIRSTEWCGRSRPFLKGATSVHLGAYVPSCFLSSFRFRPSYWEFSIRTFTAAMAQTSSDCLPAQGLHVVQGELSTLLNSMRRAFKWSSQLYQVTIIFVYFYFIVLLLSFLGLCGSNNPMVVELYMHIPLGLKIEFLGIYQIIRLDWNFLKFTILVENELSFT